MAKSQAKPRWHAPGMEDHPPHEAVRHCAAPDCDGLGEYPAPRSRDALRDYHWLCLEHIKEYNAKWDFLKGMNTAQIEAFIRESTVGDRPTRPIHGVGAGYADQLRRRVLRDFGGYQIHLNPDESALAAGFTAEHIRAFKALTLAPTRDFEFIKARYRKLAKQFHPDTNGNLLGAQEKIKSINEAYSILKAAFAPKSH